MTRLNFKLVLGLCSLLLSINFYAQDSTSVEVNKTKFHELSFDGFEALVTPSAELNYEYLLGKEQSIGAFVYKNFNSEINNNYQEEFSLGFSYRNYLYSLQPRTSHTGIFIEAFSQFSLGERFRFINLTESEKIGNWSNFGLGFMAGYKWLTQHNIVIQVHLGGGLFAFNTKKTPDSFFRGGLLLGYRF
ncbi:hypothetical protein SAMN05444278_103184 [Psychroflexus salarius]|uniref:DUF3575 domain-containing protein n=1 Tax=Psychroflexus salarius TaxID=1155689 RepID=A0A1M4V0G7_9FLAO|nr:hypothetical protein [Psychroflexus salarius]SHE62393.1 hypothetical protein SAMN05444278_103184 [Psychroflexus salarius]